MLRSILYQFGSPTVSRFQDVVDAFSRVLRNAKYSIWSDAFLGDRSLLTCKELCRGRLLYIQNTFRPLRRTAICVGKFAKAKTGLKTALKALSKDHDNVIVSASREFAYDLASVLPKEETLVITGGATDGVRAQMVDVNVMWSGFRNVIYTSAITVGVNYDRPDKFDNLLM